MSKPTLLMMPLTTASCFSISMPPDLPFFACGQPAKSVSAQKRQAVNRTNRSSLPSLSRVANHDISSGADRLGSHLFVGLLLGCICILHVCFVFEACACCICLWRYNSDIVCRCSLQRISLLFTPFLCNMQPLLMAMDMWTLPTG